MENQPADATCHTMLQHRRVTKPVHRENKEHTIHTDGSTLLVLRYYVITQRLSGMVNRRNNMDSFALARTLTATESKQTTLTGANLEVFTRCDECGSSDARRRRFEVRSRLP